MLRMYPIEQVIPPAMVTILHPNLLTRILASRPGNKFVKIYRSFRPHISN